MNKRLRRQVDAHLAAKQREVTMAEFDRMVYHEAKRRGVNPVQLEAIDPSAKPEQD